MNGITEAMAAFHGLVTLISWKDSSAQGPRLSFHLGDGRAELDHFDRVTRRSSKRAGQVYQAVATPDTHDAHSLELWFCGANWSHQDGARVTFAVTEEELAWWKQLTPRDVNDDKPTRLWLTLVQVGADGKPVNQAQADRVEQAMQAPKGGPNSKHVAQLLHDQQFQLWLAKHLGSITAFDYEACDEWVKDVCGVQSKVQFDHEPQAWELFREKVRKPFLQWLAGDRIAA